VAEAALAKVLSSLAEALGNALLRMTRSKFGASGSAALPGSPNVSSSSDSNSGPQDPIRIKSTSFSNSLPNRLMMFVGRSGEAGPRVIESPGRNDYKKTRATFVSRV
jgi:hypothetical protein